MGGDVDGAWLGRCLGVIRMPFTRSLPRKGLDRGDGKLDGTSDLIAVGVHEQEAQAPVPHC